VAILLALMSALVYGVSDYVGGRTSRRVTPISITWFSELTMLVVFGSTIPLLADSGPTSAAIGWGFVAGVSSSVAVLGLYAALSRGNMTVVAPVTGVVAAALPVAVGLLLGERPGAVAAVGIVLAIIAVGLIGGLVGATRQHVELSTIALAVGVGAGFGVLFIAYSRAGQDGGLWPLLTSRLGGVPLLAVAYVVARRRRVAGPVTRKSLAPSVVIGLMVGLGNGCYLLSTRDGLLSVVAVIVSLYPASTIMLAMALDHERANRSQLVGMVLAGVAMAAITIGS
jgi:drug/metabolite transporter (DMT)-like permease